MNKKVVTGLAVMAGFLFCAQTANASTTRDYVGDFSSYQDSTVPYMQHFKNLGMKGAIVKTGGHGGGEGYHYQNPKASAQLASASKVGMKVGTYFWGQFGQSKADAQLSAQMAVNDAKRSGLKPGAVIALDYELGASANKYGNTVAILTFGNYIQKHNYKFALYTGSSYLQNNIDINMYGARFGTSIWIANYKTMSPQVAPDFNWFPSFKYIAMWQYGSNVNGIDGSVDLVGFMSSGDVKNNTPIKPTKPNNSSQTNAKNTTYKVVAGDSWWGIANRIGLDMYTLAKLNGKTINSVIHPGQVLKIKGTLKNNAKPNKHASQATSNAQYIVKSGDSWWSIATSHGMSMYSLAMINGKSINSTIYPGQRLAIKKGVKQTQQAAARYRIVKRGDTLQYLSYLTGYSVNYLAGKNGIANKNKICVGQRIYY
ncbi:glycosyl hydrolases family 25 / endolysin [Ligilactobacillus salitolerans]|uniref:Glycosyl hydrolases family 25 / endolysin n=1 Tax=Ligilactobacillus salitolerans TaxID=1808352 RepID=A0A401IUG3_9LACO|nr:LysM peptidoglycan-binding domain-containing protein [Ligilactobacillus salitolerans]GBG95181.1 glycosyl hydrolases family 25 / endolysin [Ligilactobacillus salitolerans]